MRNFIGANKAFYILFVIFVLLLFLLLSLLTKIAPLTVSHILYNCKEAVAGLSISFPHSFPPLFALVLSFVFTIGLLLLTYQIYKTKIFVNKILKNKVNTPVKVVLLASELGITNNVIVVKGNNFSSFCYGLITPKICLSLKLVNSLTKGELKAVLIHESYHLQNKDPLKVLLGHVAVSMFFFIPILKDFHKSYTLSKELAADQLVIHNRLLGDLKSALIKTLHNLTPTFSGVASFASEEDMEQRIKALTNSHFKADITISMRKMAISIVVIIGAFIMLNLPVHAMENEDGTHSYFIARSFDEHLDSCVEESVSNDFPFHVEDNISQQSVL